MSAHDAAASEVDEYAEVNMAQRISTVNGVAEVNVYGAQKYAVRVQVDPDALASRGIGIEEVRTALARELQSARRNAGRNNRLTPSRPPDSFRRRTSSGR